LKQVFILFLYNSFFHPMKPTDSMGKNLLRRAAFTRCPHFNDQIVFFAQRIKHILHFKSKVWMNSTGQICRILFSLLWSLLNLSPHNMNNSDGGDLPLTETDIEPRNSPEITDDFGGTAKPFVDTPC
jgi:hypothetical protein